MLTGGRTVKDGGGLKGWRLRRAEVLIPELRETFLHCSHSRVWLITRNFLKQLLDDDKDTCGRTGRSELVWPSLEKLWVRWMEATGVIRATEHRMVMRPFPSAAGSDRQKPSGCLYSSLPWPGQRSGGHLAAIDFPSPMQRFWRSMQHEGICVLIKAVCSADQCGLKPGSVWPTIGHLREASGPVRRT